MKRFDPLPEEMEILGKKIVNAAYRVHKELGPGSLEKVYEACFCYEMLKGKLNYAGKSVYPLFMITYNSTKG